MSRKIILPDNSGILICRTDRIGDLILTIPLIETMKTAYPKVKLNVLISDYTAPVLMNNPYVDNIMPVEPERLNNDTDYFRQTVIKIKELNLAAALIVFPDRAVSRLIYKSGIPIRIGTARRFHSILFNKHLFHSRKKVEKHESEYNLDFAEYFKCNRHRTTPILYITDNEREEAVRIFSKAGIERPFAVIHPGSKGSADSWPVENFAELYGIMVDKGISVIMTGSQYEMKMIDSLSDKSGRKLKNLAGQTDLRQLASILALSSLVISNSTGPLHMAAAVGTPVIGIYPNTKVMSSKRWGPIGENHRVITPEQGKKMSSITVQMVLDGALEIMKKAEALN